MIGGQTYTKAAAIAILAKVTRKNGDKRVEMFAQLTAAKLNTLIGNNASCIWSTILAVDGWMAAHPVGSGVEVNSVAWQYGAATWHNEPGPLQQRTAVCPAPTANATV